MGSVKARLIYSPYAVEFAITLRRFKDFQIVFLVRFKFIFPVDFIIFENV
jgi:hypothetical protein